MFKFNKKLSKLLIIFSILLASGLGYYYFSKQTKEKVISSKFDLSQPDSRPEIIPGKIITLKRFRPEYFKDYCNMKKHPLVLKPLYYPEKTSYKLIEHNLKQDLERERKGIVFLYAIFDNKDNRLVGSIEIREFDSNGEFTCWINPQYWGKGRLQEAVKLITQEYFKLFKDKDKFNAHIEMWNLRSFFALKKAGFKLIDTLHFKDQPSRYLLEFYRPAIPSIEN